MLRRFNSSANMPIESAVEGVAVIAALLAIELRLEY